MLWGSWGSGKLNHLLAQGHFFCEWRNWDLNSWIGVTIPHDFSITPWPLPAVLFLCGESVLFSWASSGWSIVVRTSERTPQTYSLHFAFAQRRHQCPWCGLVCCLGSFWLQMGIVLLDGDYILCPFYLIVPPWNLGRTNCPWYSLKAELRFILEKGSILS